jgi:hypothetical protein
MSSIARIFVLAACVAAASSNALATVAKPTGVLPNDAGRAVTPETSGIGALIVFGGIAITMMVFCRVHQNQKPWLAVGTFAFGILAAGFTCADGQWPIGLAVGGYAIACLFQFARSRKPAPRTFQVRPLKQVALQPWEESRLTRMFG